MSKESDDWERFKNFSLFKVFVTDKELENLNIPPVLIGAFLIIVFVVLIIVL